MPTLQIPIDGPLDLAGTLALLRRGFGDPTMRLTGQRCWRATRTADGAATLAIEIRGASLVAEAWGPGAERALAGVPDLVGLNDDRTGFAARHRVIGELDRRFRGIRIPRSGAVFESLLPGILEQKVTGEEARRSFRGLMRAFGEPAPGPDALRLRLPPAPERLAALPYYAYHAFGLERRRAEVIRRAAERAAWFEATPELTTFLSAEHRLDSRALFAHVPTWLATGVPILEMQEPAEREANYRRVTPGLGRMFRERAEQLAAALPVKPRTILDVGCGSGILAIAALKLGGFLQDRGAKLVNIQPGLIQAVFGMRGSGGLLGRLFGQSQGNDIELDLNLDRPNPADSRLVVTAVFRVLGGGPPKDPTLAKGFYIEPTVFAVTEKNRIAREEIFGPVLSVFKWSDEKAMLDQVNAVEYGLTASIWTNDLSVAHRTAAAVQAGFVWINEVSKHFLGAPFGGYKQSGIGREECIEEMLAYTQEKNIHIRLKPKKS